MLILVRKCDQSITVDRNVQVKVLKIAGKSVKLGITGPKDTTIRVTKHHSVSKTSTQPQAELDSI